MKQKCIEEVQKVIKEFQAVRNIACLMSSPTHRTQRKSQIADETLRHFMDPNRKYSLGEKYTGPSK